MVVSLEQLNTNKIIMEQEFDIKLACEGQKKLCEEKKYPHFAPTSGICYSCGHNIYSQRDNKYGDQILKSGITAKSASESLVTGCPHCHRSYCD